MLSISRALKNERLLLSLTGITLHEFEELACVFDKIVYEDLRCRDRKRAVGAGYKGILSDSPLKLFYILFYLKVYPTYDLAGFIFGADRSRCFRWTKRLMPLLEKALGRHLVLPKRQIHSMQEFMALCEDVKDLFLDGTERPTQRPQKSKLQKKRYCGKKKGHTRKNSLLANERREILFLSPTKEGRMHDLRQINKTGIISHLPQGISLWVDKGFQGIQKYLNPSNAVMIPHQKEKVSHLNRNKKTRLSQGLELLLNTLSMG